MTVIYHPALPGDKQQGDYFCMQNAIVTRSNERRLITVRRKRLDRSLANYINLVAIDNSHIQVAQ